MPNDKGVTLYIRQGPKSKLYGLVAHVRNVLKYKDKEGNEHYRPSQSSLYLGYYDTFEEALIKFNEVLPQRIINFK